MHFDRIFRDLSAKKDEKLTSFLRYLWLTTEQMSRSHFSGSFKH